MRSKTRTLGCLDHNLPPSFHQISSGEALDRFEQHQHLKGATLNSGYQHLRDQTDAGRIAYMSNSSQQHGRTEIIPHFSIHLFCFSLSKLYFYAGTFPGRLGQIFLRGRTARFTTVVRFYNDVKVKSQTNAKLASCPWLKRRST